MFLAIHALLPSLASLPLVLLAAFGWIIVRLATKNREYAHLPRPATALPLLGDTLDTMFKQRRRIHDWITDVCLAHEGKHWLLNTIGRPPSIVLGTVEAYEDTLKHNFESFAKSNGQPHTSSDFFGEGIFMVDGAEWVHQRKTASHLFSLQMMRDVMEKVICEYTGELCKKFAQAARDGTALDYKLHMDLLATDVFTRIGFGVDLGCLRGKQDDGFFRAFSHGAQVIQYRIQQPGWLWRLKRWLNVGMEKQMKKDMALVNNTIYQVIQESMQQAHTGHKVARDLISLFLDKKQTVVTDENGHKTTVETTPKIIRDMAFNFIAAGRGTSAQSLTWFMLMMSRYPDVLEQLRDELRREVPALFTGEQVTPSIEQIQRLPFLEASIKESLRVNPAAPMNARFCVKDTVLRDGTLIRKGTRVVFPIYANGRMSSIWGPDAAAFKPQRWIDQETGELIKVSPYKFLAFSAGPRNCVGAKLAMMELKMVIAGVMAKFDFHTVQPPEDYTYEASLSLPVKGSVMVNIFVLKSHANSVVSPGAA